MKPDISISCPGRIQPSPPSDLYRQHGISSAKSHKWRSKFGGLDVSMMPQFKELQDDNQHLKKTYSEAQFSADLLKDALSIKR